MDSCCSERKRVSERERGREGGIGGPLGRERSSEPPNSRSDMVRIIGSEAD